jgi:hypothetical protein
MTNYKQYYKWVLALSIVPFSWLFFFFMTYGGSPYEDDYNYIFPLFLFIVQLLLSILLKSKKMLAVILFNPVFFVPLLNVIIPSVRYFANKPTIIKCSYQKKLITYDSTKLVFIEYDDDDCDFEGLYKYSHHVNNFVTDKLINWFGNPTVKN